MATARQITDSNGMRPFSCGIFHSDCRVDSTYRDDRAQFKLPEKIEVSRTSLKDRILGSYGSSNQGTMLDTVYGFNELFAGHILHGITNQVKSATIPGDSRNKCEVFLLSNGFMIAVIQYRDSFKYQLYFNRYSSDPEVLVMSASSTPCNRPLMLKQLKELKFIA